jgi:acetoacetyl-CoA synthetase
MKVEIFDDSGENIEDSGEKGDLVITKPFFSMPVGFWGEGGLEKYRNAYFEQFPGVWYHGDFIKRNPATGGYEIIGRSDGVLNPGGKLSSSYLIYTLAILTLYIGVRFGTAELYGVLDHFAEVEDCIAVGQKFPGQQDERVLLFLKLPNGKQLTEDLRSRIASAIKESLSPRHVPAGIHQVKDIPYTVNGKKIENIVRDIVSARKGKVSGTVANPECLDEYQKFAVVRSNL